MKRLLRSSLFWNANFGTLAAIVCYQITDNELITLAILALYTVKAGSNGIGDIVKNYKGIRYDKTTDKEVYITEEEAR